MLRLIASLILVGIATTIYAEEPKALRPRLRSAEAWIKEAIVRPFAEFFAYRGWVVILLFALLYKYGDALGGRWRDRSTTSSASPVPRSSASPRASVSPRPSWAASSAACSSPAMARSSPCGRRHPASRHQSPFSWQAQAGHDSSLLTFAISADNFTGALGGVAFIGYLSALHHRHGGHAVCAADLADGVRPSRSACRLAAVGWRPRRAGPAVLAADHVCWRSPGLLLLLWLWRSALKRNPSFGAEGGVVVNRLRGISRAGGTCPFRCGAWGAEAE